MTQITLQNGFPESQRAVIAQLMREYESGLGISLCFQDFEAELAALPGDYAPPHGAFITANAGEQMVGFVALRPLDHARGIAEMKRLYVAPPARGTGLGRKLAEAVIQTARELGYQHVWLDTLASMKSAITLYQTLGFFEMENYNANPIEGARFYALKLATEQGRVA